MAVGQEDDLCIEVLTQMQLQHSAREKLVSVGTFKGSSRYTILIST